MSRSSAGADVEKIKAAKVGTLHDRRRRSPRPIAKIGENMTLRRAAELSVGKGVVGSYVHNSVAEGLGKIGVLVALEFDRQGRRAQRARPHGRHACRRRRIRRRSTRRVSIRRWSRARRTCSPTSSRQQGKPANVIEKIVEFGPQDLLQGSLPARAALRPRPSKKTSAQAVKEAEGKVGGADQGHRLRALRARRGHREAGDRLRRRSGGGRRPELTRLQRAGADRRHASESRTGHLMAEPIYRRVLVKVSGEALMRRRTVRHPPGRPSTASPPTSSRRHALGVELGVVVGGGNILRGVTVSQQGMSRVDRRLHGHAGDGDERARAGERRSSGPASPARTMSALAMPQVCETYERRRALRHLEEGRIVVFAGGTGNPFFTTDTTAVLRAAEMALRCRPQGDRCRRRLQRRSQEGPERQALRPADPPGGDRAATSK